MNTIRDKIVGDVFRDMIAEMVRVRSDMPEKMHLQHQKKLKQATAKSEGKDREKDAARERIAEMLRDLPGKIQLQQRKNLQLATAKSDGKDAARDSGEGFWDLREQSQLQQHKELLLRIKEALQTGSNSRSTIGNLKSSADDTSRPLPPTDRDKSKGKYIQLDVENGVLPEQLRDMQERWQAESAKLKATECELKKLKELCIDLLDRVDQQNDEILRNKVDLEMASNGQALAQQQIMEQEEEIKNLSRIQATECIICTNEFGEHPDRQRAYWKDCNHANICYKCTRTLWSSNSKKCPICKTPASSMPTRLPPKIYL